MRIRSVNALARKTVTAKAPKENPLDAPSCPWWFMCKLTPTEKPPERCFFREAWGTF
jgi:hypothetical protein